MNRKLRVLNLEDSERDAELLRRYLTRAGYELVYARVETGAALQDALATQEWDVILSDYSMPQFGALQALALLQETGLDVPFIIISGTIGEELAVGALRAGASDFLTKDKLTRLAPAIERELQEAANRQARRQAEASLRASEAELRTLFAAMTDVICVFDRAGLYLKVVPSNPSFLYKPPANRVGKTLHEVYPQQADFLLSHIQRALAEGQAHKLEYSLHFAGQEVWFEGCVSPLSETTVVWIARDITERKRAEQERAQLIAQLESQRRRLNNIVANVPGCVFEAWLGSDNDAQTRNYVSEYVQTLLGYSVAEWLATPNFWLALVHPDDQEKITREAAASFASGEDGRHEFRWLAKDGHAVWVEARTAIIADEEGRPVGVRGVTIDISERKRVEETLQQREAQLRHAQKMEAIGTLAGGIAHDFNNVLGVITGYSELAQLSLSPDQTAQKYLAQILKASQRAKDLVQQILTFSRQKEGERKALRLQPVLEETLQLLSATLPSTIELRQQFDSRAPAVLADATQVHQVLMNLGTNAWHAMQDRGGVLEVTLTTINVDADLARSNAELRPGPYVQLTVRDTGAGMDRTTLARMYDPFFTTKAPGKGTGLGLAVVHGVIQKHQGAISVASEPGQGTTFTLYFPAHESGAVTAEVPTKPAPIGGKAHILFIDDEEPLAELGKVLLEQLGYQVTVQTCGLAALEVFRAQPGEFDLVITDQTMSRLSGLELAQALLEVRPTLPILLTTGYSATLSLEQVQTLGIRELLLKPYTAQALGLAINGALALQEDESNGNDLTGG